MTTRSCTLSVEARATRTSWTHWCGHLLAAVATLALLAMPLSAQRPAVQATARAGIASPSDDYQVACGASSLALSLDVQGSGRWFPQLSLDHFTGSGGGDVACLPVLPSVGTGVGGLRLDGATRVGVGVGGRVGREMVQLEGAVVGGLITGRRGFEGSAPRNERRFLPHVGGQASVVLFRYAVVSAAVNWTRLTLNVTPAGGGTSRQRTSWSPLSTLQVGVRVPLAKR